MLLRHALAFSLSFQPFGGLPPVANAEQVPLTAGSQSLAPVIDEGVYAFIDRLTADNSAKGLSMAVIRSDGDVEYGSWGISTESGKKVTPETLFGVASCSKAFTSAALGILMDDFKLQRNATPLPPGLSFIDRNTQLQDLLPDTWSVIDCGSGGKLSAGKCFLANHDSIHFALSNVYGPPSQFLSYSEQDLVVDILRRREHLGILGLPNQEYNDIMYMAAAHIISLYSEGNFSQFVQERIFDQLGMEYTTYSPMKAEASGLLSDSWTSSGRRIPFYQTDETIHSHAGPDGVISNVVDLAKWVKLMMNRGVDPHTNKRILSDASYEFVTVTSVAAGSRDEPRVIREFAKGWTKYAYQGMKVISHIGQLHGVSSMIAFLPDEDFGVVILANSNVSFLEPLFHRVIQRAFHPNNPDLSHHHLSRPLDYLESFTLKSAAKAMKNATLELPLASYAGAYSNPGYGSFTLCSSDGTPIDEYCVEVLESFRVVDAAPINNYRNSKQLLASWPRTWSTHLRFSHYEGNIFTSSILPPTLFPDGYGMDKTPFQITGPPGQEFCIRFVIEDGRVLGFGMIHPSIEAEYCANADEDAVFAFFAKIS